MPVFREEVIIRILVERKRLVATKKLRKREREEKIMVKLGAARHPSYSGGKKQSQECLAECIVKLPIGLE